MPDRLGELGAARDDGDALSRDDHLRVRFERAAVGRVGQRALVIDLAVVGLLLLLRRRVVVVLRRAEERSDLLGQQVLAGRLRALVVGSLVVHRVAPGGGACGGGGPRARLVAAAALGLLRFGSTTVLEQDPHVLRRDGLALLFRLVVRGCRDGGAAHGLGPLRRGLPACAWGGRGARIMTAA